VTALFWVYPAVLVAVGLLSLLSATEAALATANRREVEALAGGPDSAAHRQLEALLGTPAKFLYAFLLARLVLVTGIGATLTLVWSGSGLDLIAKLALGIGTLLLLAISRVVSRAWAMRKAEVSALRLAPVARWLAVVMAPVSVPLDWLSNLIVGHRQQSTQEETLALTEEGLRFLLGLNDELQDIDESELQMMARVMNLRTTNASEVMVPRVDIKAISMEATLPEALDVVVDAGHSRVPVFEGSIDKVVGVFYAKDFIAKYREDRLAEPLSFYTRPAYQIPPSKKLPTLLREFQEREIHLAIVVDEYGGTAGLVTIEDLVEEIFGEIRDEFDAGEAHPIRALEDGTFELHARCPLDTADEHLDLEIPDDSGVNSVGGLVFTRLGQNPARGDWIGQGAWFLQIVEMDTNNRITKILARKASPMELEAGTSRQLNQNGASY